MSLTVVIPFCSKDAELVDSLLSWIKELGSCKESELVLVQGSDVENRAQWAHFSKECFKSISIIRTPFQLPDESHPIGPNWMFETTLKHFHRIKERRPFLWLEPDAIPIKREWINEITAEYRTAVSRGKSILAHVSSLGDPNYPAKIPSGVAVYPGDSWARFYGKLQSNRGVAWDVQFADVIMPHVFPSRTIANRLNHKTAPTFVSHRSDKAPKNAMKLDDVPTSAVLFHPCKDGTLITAVRARINPSALQILTGWRETRNAPKNVSMEADEKAQPLRYVHVVERHAQSNPADEPRIERAFNSWVEIYKSGRMIPCHIWDHPRTSAEMGDDRKLPYLRDLLVEGMTLAGDDDVVVWTNDDTILHARILFALDQVLAKVDACGSMRLNFNPENVPAPKDPIPSVLSKGSVDLGRDVFAFRKSWLRKHWKQIPDFLIGELEFDLVLTVLVRKSAGVVTDRMNLLEPCPACEIPRGYVMHVKHTRAWVSAKYAESPAKAYNRKLSVQFYSRNNMPSMIPTT